MKTSLFPLALSSVLSTALCPTVCGGLALQFTGFFLWGEHCPGASRQLR